MMIEKVNLIQGFDYIYYIFKTIFHYYFISDDDNDDDDEDDELALQRELEKIKAERAIAQAKKEEEEKAIEEALNKESALRGNPLLNLDTSGTSNEKVN